MKKIITPTCLPTIPSTDQLFAYWLTLQKINLYLTKTKEYRGQLAKHLFKFINILFKNAIIGHQDAMTRRSNWSLMTNPEYAALYTFFKNELGKPNLNDQIFLKKIIKIRRQLRLLTYSKKRSPLSDEEDAKLCIQIKNLTREANCALNKKIKSLT